MKLDLEGRVAEFNELQQGSILLTNFRGQGVLRAIKAFVNTEDNRRLDRIVTVGPFTNNDQGRPTIYEPGPLRDQAVYDQSEFVRFSPSLMPEDILPQLPVRRECLGLIFLMKDRVLLGAKYFLEGQDWDTGYLDVNTGEITFRIDQDRIFAVKRWSIVAVRDKRQTVFSYPPR